MDKFVEQNKINYGFMNQQQPTNAQETVEVDDPNLKVISHKKKEEVTYHKKTKNTEGQFDIKTKQVDVQAEQKKGPKRQDKKRLTDNEEDFPTLK